MSLAIASCGYPRPADVPDLDATGGPGYQLLAITPAIAMTGETVTLEGTFAATAMVQFPGGAMQTATVLGEHRATVVVPETATAGDLTVATGSVTVGPLPFRRTSFALGLQPFRASYEQTDGAQQWPSLRIARSSASAVVTNGWLYTMGGADGAGALSSVERAMVHADGSIGAFDLVGDVALAEARSGHTSVTIGSMVYVIGGSSRGVALASVERAEIHADGSLGSFAPAQTALVAARSGHTSTIVGNTVYVIGGTGRDGARLASVERAAIQRDGSLGPFAAVPDAALSIGRTDHSTELVGSALYVVGGDTGGAASNTVERATIRLDGSLGAFSVESVTRLTTPRRGLRTAVLAGAVYVLGGGTAGVERASIAPTGSLAPFGTVSSAALGTPRSGHALAVIGNWLYAIGGTTPGGPTRTLERASINVDSALGSFAASNVMLVHPRAHHSTTVIRDSIYVIGQAADAPTIERASIQRDGSIKTFVTVTGTSLVANHFSHCTAVVGNFVYVLGGQEGLSTTDIERATINSDGSLGTFSVVSSTLQEGRFGHACVVLGNYLYVISGIGTNHMRLTTTERAVIHDDGTLGSFATLPGITLNTGRNFFRILATDRYLYVMGGFDQTALDASIERSQIGPDGSPGPFVTASSFLGPRGTHTATVVGDAVYVVGGRNPGGATTFVEKAIINADGSLGGFAVTSILTANRARHAATPIGNLLYLIGGETELPDETTMLLLTVGYAGLR